MATKKESVTARLTLVVEYEDLPEESELERLVDEARSYGEVVTADFELLKLVKKSLK